MILIDRIYLPKDIYKTDLDPSLEFPLWAPLLDNYLADKA